VTTPLWVRELVAAFWERAGSPGPFPRSLGGAIIRSALDLTIKELAGLTTNCVSDYLKKFGSGFGTLGPHWPLRGCLAAYRGAGFIFIDAADPPDERRFTLAHELAHFLRDYWLPRGQAERILGPTVREVFDGVRPPTPTERVHALLRNVPLGCHVHLMARDEGSRPLEVEAAERDADLVAFELLAPAAEVLARCPADEVKLAEALTNDFGLPPGAACEYAGLLRPAPPIRADPLLRQFRESAESCRTSARSPGTIRGEHADGRT
jgi:hypothetical protein